MNARFLLFSILITFLLFFLPYAQVVTYPFLIFSTFIHETSHAAAAVITGGHVESLTVKMNGSGVTYTRGGAPFLISNAGYMGTSLFGGLLLIFSRNKAAARSVLYACAILISVATAAFVGQSNNLIVLALLGVSIMMLAKLNDERHHSTGYLLPGISMLVVLLLILYLFVTGSLFSWAAGLVLTISLFAIARFAKLSFVHFFLTFLAVQCSLNAFDAVKTVYFLSLRSTCANDAAIMTAITGIPAWLWAALWLILSIFILLLSAMIYVRRSPRPQI